MVIIIMVFSLLMAKKMFFNGGREADSLLWVKYNCLLKHL